MLRLSRHPLNLMIVMRAMGGNDDNHENLFYILAIHPSELILYSNENICQSEYIFKPMFYLNYVFYTFWTLFSTIKATLCPCSSKSEECILAYLPLLWISICWKHISKLRFWIWCPASCCEPWQKLESANPVVQSAVQAAAQTDMHSTSATGDSYKVKQKSE